MHRRISRVCDSGFTLIEAMVALVVLSVGMIGIAAMYGQGLGASRSAIYRTQAVNVAADMGDRIRVNRIGGAAYGGAPADHKCDPVGGGGIDCTPVEMAAHDLFVWEAEVQNLLPGGVGTVGYEGGSPPRYTIKVSWVEGGTAGTPAQSVTSEIQVPII